MRGGFLKKTFNLFALVLCLLLAGCQGGEPSAGADASSSAVSSAGQEKSEYEQLLENAPLAEVDGVAKSPCGRFTVRTEGESDHYVSGYRIPEKLQIVDKDGTVLWEDLGRLRQSVLWSPGGDYVAIVTAGRTWNTVMVVETETWSSWTVMLPDGDPIPEYTFLPEEDWGEWIEDEVLRIAVGRGGDDGTQRIYRCYPRMTTDKEGTHLTGHTLEEGKQVLSEDCDPDHDGQAEIITLTPVWSPELPNAAAYYELQVEEKDGTVRWMRELGTAHVGWGSFFAYQEDGRDYLVRYSPYMGQGAAWYDYVIFSLDADGEEVLLRGNAVEFDVNFGSPVHQSYDAETIAAFLEEVHGYLDDSVLLVSTEGGELQIGGSGADFDKDMFFTYDESLSLEENLEAYRDKCLEERAQG